MTFTICNGSPSAVSVCIGYSNRNECANAGAWTKQGWWNIAPGGCARVYGGSLAFSRYWAYYARSTDRSREWSGQYNTYVVDRVFRQCWNEPSVDPQFGQFYEVGFRLLDINSSDYTQNLTA